MDEDNIMIGDPVVDPYADGTLAQTDEVIPTPMDGDECPMCAELTPEVPGCPESLPEGGVTLGAFFGTIQECVTIAWRFHLKTRKHHIHVTLNEFYDEALDIVDDIIEQYQGINGVIDEPFTNSICPDGKTETEYLRELKSFVETNKSMLGDHTEINSTIDNFLGLIDSTIYKIESFNESEVKSFDEYCYENLNESCCCGNCDEEDDENTEDCEEE